MHNSYLRLVVDVLDDEADHLHDGHEEGTEGETAHVVSEHVADAGEDGPLGLRLALLVRVDVSKVPGRREEKRGEERRRIPHLIQIFIYVRESVSSVHTMGQIIITYHNI